MLGCAYGRGKAIPGPVGRAEYRSRSGKKARILSEADPSGAAELCAPPERRGTQGIGDSRRGLRVPFSLGTFSWARKRKYLARQGET